MCICMSVLCYLGLRCGVDGVLVHAVLFAQLHALRPSLVLLVQVRSNATELQQFVLFHLW